MKGLLFLFFSPRNKSLFPFFFFPQNFFFFSKGFPNPFFFFGKSFVVKVKGSFPKMYFPGSPKILFFFSSQLFFWKKFRTMGPWGNGLDYKIKKSFFLFCFFSFWGGQFIFFPNPKRKIFFFFSFFDYFPKFFFLRSFSFRFKNKKLGGFLGALIFFREVKFFREKKSKVC